MCTSRCIPGKPDQKYAGTRPRPFFLSWADLERNASGSYEIQQKKNRNVAGAVTATRRAVAEADQHRGLGRAFKV